MFKIFSIILEIVNSLTTNIDAIVNRMCIEPGVISVKYNKLGKFMDDDDDDYEVK